MRGTIQNGDKLGPFVIVAKLGRGGMSTVYSAYEAGLDREVALKVLPVDLLEEQGFTERFEREARLIAKLEHPHIVPLYSYGIDEGVPWMALRLVRGGHLGERMEREPLGVAQGLAYFTMIADALDHAHMMGVVHRDLKPQNVLLGERGELYLADFGISRLLQGRTTITNTGAVLGTPQYMSPEQAQDGHVGPMADIYALGVMVYQWLAGVLPFDADTPFAVMYKHVSQPPAMEPLAHLPERARAAMARALEKQQELRWPTAGAFIEELAAGLDQGALGPAQPDKDLPTGQVPKSVVAAISARRLHKVSNTGTDATPVQVPVQVPAQAKASLRTPQPPAPTVVTGRNSATVVRATPVSATPPGGNEPLPAASLQFRGKAAPPPPKKSNLPLVAGGLGGVVLLLAAGWWFTRGGDEGAVADVPPPAATPADTTAAAVPAAPPPLPVGDARLLIESDARCELAVDDVARGVLEPLTPLRLELPAGDYQLRCTSTEHPEFVVAQVAKVVIEEPTVALFELKARIENKVQKQQAEAQRMADEAKAEADARRLAEEREAEEALRRASEARQREQDQLAAETRKLEEARRAAEERRQAEARKLAEARAAVGRTRDGTPAASPAQAREERQDRRAAVADAARERERVRLAEAERVAAEKRQQEQARRLAEAQRIEKEAAAAAAAAAAASAQAAQAPPPPPPEPVPAAPPPRTTPIPLSTPQPAYPVDALRSKLTGDVDVAITIGRDGRVLAVRVLSAKPRGVFERSVQETVKRWRFEPLDQEVTVNRTIRFR